MTVFDLPFGLDWLQLILASGAIFLGAFVQSSIGFGMGVVAAPMLFSISPDLIPSPIMLVSLTLSMTNLRRYRHDLQLGPLRASIIGMIPGSIVAGLILSIIDQRVLSLLLASVVLMAVAVSLFRFSVSPNKTNSIVAGFMSGFMGTSTAIGGPPIALLYQNETGNAVRANLSAFFTVSCIVGLMVLFPFGVFTMEHVWIALLLLPANFLGFRLALKLVHKFSPASLRYFTLAVCTLAAFGAIRAAL